MLDASLVPGGPKHRSIGQTLCGPVVTDVLANTKCSIGHLSEATTTESAIQKSLTGDEDDN